MEQLKQTASFEQEARFTYEKMCSLLKQQLKLVIGNVKTGHSLLLYPDRGFNCDEHVIQPWAKLEVARCVGLQRFLDDAPGSEALKVSSCTRNGCREKPRVALAKSSQLPVTAFDLFRIFLSHISAHRVPTAGHRAHVPPCRV